MVEVEKTKLKNVLLFKHFAFEDHRGTYEELYNKKDYTDIIKKEIGHDVDFLEDNITFSSKNVLRGFYGDEGTWKLVTCPKGKIYIVLLDYDAGSGQFGLWQDFVLSERNAAQLLIPPKYGYAYMIMSESAIFYCKRSRVYQEPNKQFNFKHDDSRFNVFWPVKNPIISYEHNR